MGKLYEVTQNDTISVLKAAVLHLSQYDLVPELLDLLGEEKFCRFLEIFGGRCLMIPSLPEVKRMIRDVEIWIGLSGISPDLRDKQIERLSKVFNLSRTRLLKIYDKMSRLMSSSGIIVKVK